jgi:C-terminal processing protease CtpA/Prc
MKVILSFLVAAAVAATAAGADDGIIGVAVSAKPDFRVITAILPQSPAARADVRVGDQIVAIDGFPTAKLQTVQALLSKVYGRVGSEIELQLKRPATKSLLRLRLRRVAPATLKPPKIPPEFERYQA